MTRKLQTTCTRLAIISCLFALALAGSPTRIDHAAAQSNHPVLISDATSTRAIAVESVTRQREPFSVKSSVQFGVDNRTRIMLFAKGLTLQPGDTASSVTA